jgi:transcriptional regulator GlxA family with amidase domain
MPKSFANLVKVGRPKEEETRTIAFVAYPGVMPLDLIAPMTTFLGLTRGLVGTSHQYRTVCVAERTEPIDSNTPMAVVPDNAFEEVSAPFAIIVPGGGISSLEAMGNERLINYLRFAAHGAEIVGSVSTGAFILAAAGLLENRQATTHPAYGELLKKLGVSYAESDWLEDGRFITAAGVSGGIDMALSLVARLKNEQEAKNIQTVIEYDPHPPFGGIEHDGTAREDRLETMLAEHKADLERALMGRQDLYQKLFG